MPHRSDGPLLFVTDRFPPQILIVVCSKEESIDPMPTLGKGGSFVIDTLTAVPISRMVLKVTSLVEKKTPAAPTTACAAFVCGAPLASSSDFEIVMFELATGVFKKWTAYGIVPVAPTVLFTM